MRKIKLTKDFGEKLQEIAKKAKMKPEDVLIELFKHVVPPEKTVVTEHDKKVAKKLAIKYQGKYGFPKLKN